MRWQRQMGQKRFCFIGSNRPQKMHAINASKKVCDGYEWNTVTSPINNKCAKYQLTSDNPAPSIFRNLITKTAILDSIQMNDDWSRGGGARGQGDKVQRWIESLWRYFWWVMFPNGACWTFVNWLWSRERDGFSKWRSSAIANGNRIWFYRRSLLLSNVSIMESTDIVSCNNEVR